jgi:energy-coupling factor transporter ATP-binding protein EcfA2
MASVMRLTGAYLTGHRSVEDLEFDMGPFTVLFGKNNAGKTNILETLLGVLDPGQTNLVRRTHAGRPSSPEGAVIVELEPGLSFDDALLAEVSTSDHTPRQICFTRDGVVPTEPIELMDEWGILDRDLMEARAFHSQNRPRILALDWAISDIHERVSAFVEELASNTRRGAWMEVQGGDGDRFSYRVPAGTEALVSRIASLATDLLPDFVDGSVRAHVTSAELWDKMPKVLLEYEQRGATQCADLVDAAGNGAARWMAAAVQIAMQIARDFPDAHALRDLERRASSRYVLLIDEPEAHLHPSAVASMVRWCDRMTNIGFNLVVASHHEEFLRAAKAGVTLVHVTRDADLVTTSARTLSSAATHQLLELAEDVGMHPATALSLHRAILFVEGPSDDAVLDEYGGVELDAAGVKVLPVHGTKNLEGLVAVELVTELGMRMGILTDATDTDTMGERSSRKRSSEEKKVLRVLQIAAEKGLPAPVPFGVPEEDLLFALPADAIRDEYLKGGPFPEWKELVAECRNFLGKGPSDSVNWKEFAHERYMVPIDSPAGVRDVVRVLDLAGIPLPSIRMVLDQILAWAANDEGSGASAARRPDDGGRD